MIRLLAIVLVLSVALGGCVSPGTIGGGAGSDEATVAVTVGQALAEAQAVLVRATAEIERRRTAAGIAPDKPMTANEWIFLGLELMVIVNRYVVLPVGMRSRALER